MTFRVRLWFLKPRNLPFDDKVTTVPMIISLQSNAYALQKAKENYFPLLAIS